jgi:hypothetical protein
VVSNSNLSEDHHIADFVRPIGHPIRILANEVTPPQRARAH